MHTTSTSSCAMPPVAAAHSAVHDADSCHPLSSPYGRRIPARTRRQQGSCIMAAGHCLPEGEDGWSLWSQA